MTEGRPLLLIDIDGVLNPFGAVAPPPDYRVFEYRKTGSEDDRMRVWLKPEHGEMLLAAADVFDLVWATSWTHAANDFVAPILGLPPLPMLDFDSDEYAPLCRPSHVLGEVRGVYPVYWKTAAVAAYTAGRAFCWIDDGTGHGDELALSAQASVGPHLLLHTDPAIVAAAVDWAQATSGERRPSAGERATQLRQ